MKQSALLTLALVAGGAAPLFAQGQETPPPAPKPQQDDKKPAKSSEQADKALQAKIARLVDGLGAEAYEVREKSFDALIAIGPPAVPALEKAKQSDDPEVAAAAAEAIAEIRARHRLPRRAPRTEERPQQPEQPRRPEARPGQLPDGLQPAIPGRDEMLEQLQKQFPEMEELLKRFKSGNSQLRLLDPNDPLFKDLFQGRNPFEEMFGQRGEGRMEEREGPNGRSRVFTWSNVPRRAGPAARLGLRTRRVSPVLRAQLQLAPNQGLAVHQVFPRSYAASQGVRQYDVLLSALGRPVRTEADLAELVAKGGQVVVLRHAKPVTLTFGPAPQTNEPPRVAPQPRPRKAPRPAPQQDDSRDF